MLWFVQQSFVLLALAWMLGFLAGWLIFGRRRGWAEPMTDLIPVVEEAGAQDAGWVPAQWSPTPSHHDYADPVWVDDAALDQRRPLIPSPNIDVPAIAPAETAARPATAPPPPAVRPAGPPAPPRLPQPAPRASKAAPRPPADPGDPRPAGDDLTRIDGVTPEVAAALRAAGLGGFSAIARADVDALRAALTAAGLTPTFMCGYWPTIASDLADGARATPAVPAVPAAGRPPVRTTGGDEPEAEPATATIDIALTETDPVPAEAPPTVDLTDPEPDPEPTLDEFERIDGVTLAAAEALRTAGITTFTQISEAPHGRLREALTAAGVRVPLTLTTWGTQARRLAASDAGAARAARAASTGVRR